jgi:hypothetical protein
MGSACGGGWQNYCMAGKRMYIEKWVLNNQMRILNAWTLDNCEHSVFNKET